MKAGGRKRNRRGVVAQMVGVQIKRKIFYKE